MCGFFVFFIIIVFGGGGGYFVLFVGFYLFVCLLLAVFGGVLLLLFFGVFFTGWGFCCSSYVAGSTVHDAGDADVSRLGQCEDVWSVCSTPSAGTRS